MKTLMKKINKKEALNLAKKNKMDFIIFVFENEKIAPNENEIQNIYTGDAVSFDLRLNEDVIINFEKAEKNLKKTVLIGTGCKWCAPPGIYLQIVPRSGISLNTSLKISNSPGTIEPSYRNEIKLIIDYSILYLLVKDTQNISFNYKDSIFVNNNTFYIKKYIKFAQAIISTSLFYFNIYGGKPINIFYVIDKELYENWHKIFPSKRSLNGFGSTGI